MYHVQLIRVSFMYQTPMPTNIVMHCVTSPVQYLCAQKNVVNYFFMTILGQDDDYAVIFRLLLRNLECLKGIYFYRVILKKWCLLHIGAILFFHFVFCHVFMLSNISHDVYVVFNYVLI